MRVSRKVESSGTSPGCTVYDSPPEEPVKVCTAFVGTAPFGVAPVSESTVKSRLKLRSSSSARRIEMSRLTSFTRSLSSP